MMVNEACGERLSRLGFGCMRLPQTAEKAIDEHELQHMIDYAAESDIVFLCVRPVDIKDIIVDIDGCIGRDALLVSLNGNVTFDMIGELTDHKTAKVIPSVTAWITPETAWNSARFS